MEITPNKYMKPADLVISLKQNSVKFACNLGGGSNTAFVIF